MYTESKMWELYEDPLLPANLEFRFKLFEVFCLPGILKQTSQSFKWVILKDKDLPEKYLQRLKKLVEGMQNIYLHTFDPVVSLESMAWLKPYLDDEREWLITTNLDDDDVLPLNYIETIQFDIQSSALNDRLPVVKIYATTNVRQWDAISSHKSPFGLICNKLPAPSNIGFSLLVNKGLYDLTVWKLRHVLAESYFEKPVKQLNKNVEYGRKALKLDDPEAGLNQWEKNDLFYDVGQLTDSVLLVNHFKNVQQWRLHKSKDGCEIVSGADSIPGRTVNFELFRKYRNDFSKTQAFFYMLRLLLSRKYMAHKGGGRPQKLKNFIILIRWYFWR